MSKVVLVICLHLLFSSVSSNAQVVVDEETEYGNSFLSAIRKTAPESRIEISAGEIAIDDRVVGYANYLVPEGDTIRLMYDDGEELATLYVWSVNRAIIGFRMTRYTDLGDILTGQALRSAQDLVDATTDVDADGQTVEVAVFTVSGERRGWMKFSFREGFAEEYMEPWTMRLQTNMMPKRDGTPREIDWIFRAEPLE